LALIEIDNFNFSYIASDGIGENSESLKGIDLKVDYGEFVLICGPSGCGKTTLLTNLKKELMPNGIRSGNIKFEGTDISDLDDLSSACDIAYLFQNPDSQIVTDTVIQEIAFPLENIGLDTEEIRNRISEIVAFFGINDILHKNVNELSGGQKQLVNLCSLLVLRPKVLLLDEPMSQLDPIASYDFLSILRRLNEEFSITIIISEHKSDSLFSFVDKVVFMEDGKIKFNDRPSEVCHLVSDDDIFTHYLPAVYKIYSPLSDRYSSLNKLNIPLSIREGRRVLNTIHDDLIKISNSALENPSDLSDDTFHTVQNSRFSKILSKVSENTLIKMDGVYFSYEKNNLILKNIDFTIDDGEFLAIIGGNGVGKSTFLQILTGLLKPIKGKVKYRKGIKISYVHQNPMIHFSKDTVKEELLDSLNLDNDTVSNLLELPLTDFLNSNILNNIKFNNSNSTFMELIEFFNIKHILNQHPYDCSGGEMQKTVILKALLKDPDILVLDEPTKGLDPISNLNLASMLNSLNANGLTVIMTSHDLDFVANNCPRCLMLFDKNIQIDNHPKRIFSQNNFYTTFVNRMVKDYLPNAITLSDVLDLWNLK